MQTGGTAPRDLPYAVGAGKRLQRFHTRKTEILGSDLTAIASLIACKIIILQQGREAEREEGTGLIPSYMCKHTHVHGCTPSPTSLCAETSLSRSR